MDRMDVIIILMIYWGFTIFFLLGLYLWLRYRFAPIMTSPPHTPTIDEEVLDRWEENRLENMGEIEFLEHRIGRWEHMQRPRDKL